MPNRASALAWDDPASPTPGGLTRAAVVRAAIAIADVHGLDAVSIRRIGAELDARPMSLYSHIASKDDLLDLMVNDAIAGALLPEPLPEHWREALAEIARYSYASFVAHPWVLEAFSRRPQVGPNAIRHAEQSATAVAGLELAPRDAWTVLGIVDDYTLGHATSVVALGEGVPPMPELDADEFPQLARIAPPESDRSPEETFELGLQAVLDGVEHRFASSRYRPTS